MKITLRLPENPARTSDIVIAEGVRATLSSDLGARTKGKTVYWIWDRRVWALWQRQAADFGWPGQDSGRFVEFDASESNKRLAAVEDLARKLVRSGADRGSALVAVGGGVTGDVVGMLASIYMRGIPVFQIPTTLLAQVDSSVGGKTGVDLPEGKNLLGAFHQPDAVWIDPLFLESLPAEEFRQGMAEVIKTALLGDETLWGLLESDIEALKRREGEALARTIYACCRVKADVVEADEKESGRRRVLNLGHTVGHALERLSRYELRHGDAVAMGLAAAAKLAVRMDKMAEEDRLRLENLCSAWGLPVRIPGNFSPAEILEAIQSDKKRLGAKLHFILPVRPGEVLDYANPDRDLLARVLSELTQR